MPNLAAVLKDEIRRLARKEIKAETAISKRSVAQHRKDITELKRQVRDLTREVAYLRRQDQESVRTPSTPDPAVALRFSPGWVEAHRHRLQLSAADYGELVGVSALTIYNWEKGRTRPRQQQLAAWAEVRTLGKRDALMRLEL
jgi:DNA-binding transcriptional regulator YiaG